MAQKPGRTHGTTGHPHGGTPTVLQYSRGQLYSPDSPIPVSIHPRRGNPHVVAPVLTLKTCAHAGEYPGDGTKNPGAHTEQTGHPHGGAPTVLQCSRGKSYSPDSPTPVSIRPRRGNPHVVALVLMLKTCAHAGKHPGDGTKSGRTHGTTGHPHGGAPTVLKYSLGSPRLVPISSDYTGYIPGYPPIPVHRGSPVRNNCVAITGRETAANSIV